MSNKKQKIENKSSGSKFIAQSKNKPKIKKKHLNNTTFKKKIHEK